MRNRSALGVIVGNRDFFPDHLVADARRDVLAVLEQHGITAVILEEVETKVGGVETYQDAQKCARLFRSRRDDIGGILVVLPNFGDEKGVADTIKLSGLHVPVLVQAYPDALDALNVERRRDAFCGKLSVCNNLRQYGFPFSVTEKHTVHPRSDAFGLDLDRFAGVCRVVNGIRSARLGAVGARPSAFNTVRFSEKLLQAHGVSVCTVDLSEILGTASDLADGEERVTRCLQEIKDYVEATRIPAASLLKMAKLAVALDGWMAENELDATAIQCWDAVQSYYGVNVCGLMSMMSEKLLPSACEMDISGALSMYALQLASGRPSALVDWNNNYADDPERCVLFHCGNWPKSFYGGVEMSHADVLATTLGADNTRGALAGRVPAGPMSFCRVSTDDVGGRMRCYLGEGRFTDDPLDTFGSRAVVKVPELQRLMRYLSKQGFEHHVAMSASRTSAILAEAFETYLGWDVYWHES